MTTLVHTKPGCTFNSCRILQTPVKQQLNNMLLGAYSNHQQYKNPQIINISAIFQSIYEIMFLKECLGYWGKYPTVDKNEEKESIVYICWLKYMHSWNRNITRRLLTWSGNSVLLCESKCLLFLRTQLIF